jgi:hypothetical protein
VEEGRNGRKERKGRKDIEGREEERKNGWPKGKERDKKEEVATRMTGGGGRKRERERDRGE